MKLDLSVMQIECLLTVNVRASLINTLLQNLFVRRLFINCKMLIGVH